MKNKEIRELGLKDLDARKKQLKEELFHLRIQKVNGQLENPKLPLSIRREIARVETIKNEKIRTSAKAQAQEAKAAK